MSVQVRWPFKSHGNVGRGRGRSFHVRARECDTKFTKERYMSMISVLKAATSSDMDVASISKNKSARTYPKPFELLEGCRFDLVVMAVVPATPPFAEPRELPCILGGWKSNRLGHRWFQYGFSNPIYEPRNNLIGNHPIDAF